MNTSPRIESLLWGRITVEGVKAAFKDVKLFPGGAREWDWNETDTHHRPGIQPGDVRELIEHGVEIVVLARGHEGRLEIMRETRALLAGEHVEVFVADTPAAVERYNRLAEAGQPVGALIHSTC